MDGGYIVFIDVKMVFECMLIVSSLVFILLRDYEGYSLVNEVVVLENKYFIFLYML